MKWNDKYIGHISEISKYYHHYIRSAKETKLHGRDQHDPKCLSGNEYSDSFLAFSFFSKLNTIMSLTVADISIPSHSSPCGAHTGLWISCLTSGLFFPVQRAPAAGALRGLPQLSAWGLLSSLIGFCPTPHRPPSSNFPSLSSEIPDSKESSPKHSKNIPKSTFSSITPTATLHSLKWSHLLRGPIIWMGRSLKKETLCGLKGRLAAVGPGRASAIDQGQGQPLVTALCSCSFYSILQLMGWSPFPLGRTISCTQSSLIYILISPQNHSRNIQNVWPNIWALWTSQFNTQNLPPPLKSGMAPCCSRLTWAPLKGSG